MSIQQQLESGLAHHQAGRLAEAEGIYRQILAQQPDHAEASHLLGVLLAQAGRMDAAVETIRRAIAVCSTNPIYYCNLGKALEDCGRIDEAIAAYRQAIRIKPDLANMHNHLGMLLQRTGQPNEAINFYRQAIRLKPDYADAHNNLGIALQVQGQVDESIACYRQAIRLKPDLAQLHSNLGNALMAAGLLEEAIVACRQAIGIKADYAEAYNNLGNALMALGKLDEAIAAFRQTVGLKPDFADAQNNLGNALTAVGQSEQAVAACRTAIGIKPDYAEAYNNLGNALMAMGQLDEAIAGFRRAIALKPDYAEAYNNLANALTGMGQLDEALAAYRQALGLKPELTEAHSTLLFAMNYHPDLDAQTILAEHRAWSVRHAPPPLGEQIRHPNETSPDRRLRIGYVSGDFRRHSVGYFFLPLLEHHDRRVLEIFGYANVPHGDDFTERMKHSCNVWRNIVGLADEAAAQLICSDGIDILVDLSGHTAGNRLGVLARKPAPIQVTYLGYANTTGMTAIDYRLTDALADPPGLTDQLNVEKLWRLPACAWCYHPLDETPDVRPRGDRPITFGCFNAFAKINHKMAAIWAELLQRVPESRLLLKSAGAGEASSRQRLTGQFAELGISSDRIKMRGKIADSRQHLQLYGQVDVALDTYPYHGTTTTCEALWMGVPVVSLAGRTHVSRVGVSLLTNAGLPELIAQTPEQYVEIAADLAGNLPRLAELRRTLRERIQASPLMDAPHFARHIEAAYRQMWRNWCGGPQVA